MTKNSEKGNEKITKYINITDKNYVIISVFAAHLLDLFLQVKTGAFIILAECRQKWLL